eukprot:jgi/Mesvir1/26532/Mv16187-RA.1
MSTKLIPVDLEEEEAGSGGGVSAPAVRGGVMDNVEFVEDDDGDWPAQAPHSGRKHKGAPYALAKKKATAPPRPPSPAANDEEAGAAGGYVMRGPGFFRPDIPIPVNMDRVVREVVPPAPPPPAAVQVIDDEAGDSGVEDGSVRGWDSDVRKVQVDAVKKKAKRRSGGKKSQTAASATDDPSRVTMDL